VPGDEGERERDVEGEEAAGIEAASALLMTEQKAAEEQAMLRVAERGYAGMQPK